MSNVESVSQPSLFSTSDLLPALGLPSRNLLPITFNNTINLSSINEFYMVNPAEANSCIFLTRSVINGTNNFVVQHTPLISCSKPKHILCKTRARIIGNDQRHCFRKPSTLGVPVMISNDLTHELCSSICRGLLLTLTIINRNKCYCFEHKIPAQLSNQSFYEKYRKDECGFPCPGMQFFLLLSNFLD